MMKDGNSFIRCRETAGVAKKIAAGNRLGSIASMVYDRRMENTFEITWVGGDDALASRERHDVRGVIVHRIEVSQEDPTYGDNPGEVARFFRDHPIGRRATGGAMPYPILIDDAGIIFQTAPLSLITPHAVSHNPSTVGVACIGDFRTRSPSAAQTTALISVCASLLAQFDLPPEALHGHDELTGASHDPEKECPGKTLSMVALRRDVSEFIDRGGVPMTFNWKR